MSDVSVNGQQSRWIVLFETLIPQKEVSAVDICGGEHHCTAMLPARKQQRVISKLLEILDLPAVNLAGFAALEGAAPAEQVGELLNMIRRVAGDDAVLKHISEVVKTAYPSIVDAAISNVRTSSPEMLEGITNPDAADVMEVDQLLGLLLPFVSRLLGGMSQKVKMFQVQPSQKILNA